MLTESLDSMIVSSQWSSMVAHLIPNLRGLASCSAVKFLGSSEISGVMQKVALSS